MEPLKKIRSRLRSWSQVRFKEPIAIFESDDWGLWRSPGDKTTLESFGEPKIWGYDQLESIDELEAFYRVFEKYTDSEGNRPFAEANFVVSNPDFNATTTGGYKEIILKPITQDSERLTKWNEGISRKVFLPQYHGRLHFNYKKMHEALLNDPLSRKIFEAGIHGGMNNYKDGQWGLHSEYLDWTTGAIPENIQQWTLSGLDQFEKAFGYRAKSTVAPQYIFSPEMTGVFSEAGLTCIQGTNMQLYKTTDGTEYKRNLPNGSHHYKSLVGISRNVKFEPARGVEGWDTKAAIKNAKRLIASNIPVIIDSHRINYVGRFSVEGLSKLDQFMSELLKTGVRFVASFELAEAISNNGKYTEFWSGKTKQLHSIGESNIKKWIRDRVVTA